MFDVRLALNLTSHVFSNKRGSLRFPTPRRIVSGLVILPLFFVLILVNRVFMLLDWLVFPGFRKMQLDKTCFIIGVPRSATTYLLHLLAKDKEQFTCFALWEILLAPSVIQKYFWLAIVGIDRRIGRPLFRLSLQIDKILLGKIATIHATSLSQPEEDEMLLIYTFGSMYLAFFFPEVKSMDPHLFFDEGLSEAKRKKLMLFYKRCVQRHAFVFNRAGDKYFLSKNPCFISKTASIATTFPRAKLLYMLRSPYKTIPSTISLNANVYSLFSGARKDNPLACKTTEVVIRWYEMANASIEKNWNRRSMTVPFKKITGQPEATVKSICQFLQLQPSCELQAILKKEQDKCGEYKSVHRYQQEESLQNTIGNRLDFVVNGMYQYEI